VNIRETNESPNDVFCDRIFEWILRRFGEGFGRDFGGFWLMLDYSRLLWVIGTLLWLTLACFCFSGLLWLALAACAFRSIAAQVYEALVALFSFSWLIFSIF